MRLAGISASNLRRFLDQSINDSSVSSRLFTAWEVQLRQALEAQDVKYEYATLFSRLVTERSGDDTALPIGSHPEGLTMEGNFEAVRGSEQAGRVEMHEQRRDWESYVFTPSNVDPGAV